MTDVLVARVAQALAALSDDQREALVLRDRDGLSYAEIGERVDRSIDGTAVLLVAARMSLRERVLGGERIPTSGEYCTQARAWLSSMEDGEHLEVDEIQWTRAHVRECETCTTARRALREACLAGRAWAAAGAPAPVDDEDDFDDDDDDWEEHEEEELEDEASEPGTALERRDGPGVEMARYRRPSALNLLRRRAALVAGVGGTVLVLGLLILSGGGTPSSSRTASTPSDGGVVPPPTARFCAAGEPGC